MNRLVTVQGITPKRKKYKMNSNTVNGIVVRHPLSDKVVTNYTGWTEWLAKWNQETNQQVLISLLHTGYQLGTLEQPGTSRELSQVTNQFLFYLSVADGWNEGVPQYWGGQNYGNDAVLSTKKCELRTEIAQKAFSVLCQYPFKEWIDRNGISNEYRKRYTSPHVLYTLMNFFGTTGEDGSFSLRNLKRFDSLTHQDRCAREFLFLLIQTIWYCRKEDQTIYVSMRNTENLQEITGIREAKKVCIDVAVLWSIEVLNALGCLDKLKHESELGDAVERKLKEIALRANIGRPHVQNLRKVRSLDEALKAGDAAAWFLHRYRTIKIAKSGKTRRRKKARSC
jgi:hypothetical protein